ncbi:hypothetical protein ACFQT0_28590 [Hymenobacter humi]|uniref:Uncharacterized protein n=1 Tax=Hymenobacter humi TaxID=1411620 RepID=A0ABW2UEZ5_9BACT
MLPLLQLERNIGKFQQTIQVPEYDNVIDKLLRKAGNLNIGASFWNETYSKAQDTNGIYYLWIKSSAVSGNRKELVYDMMHELGHCLDPLKLGKENKGNAALELAREERAWALADLEFNAHPELQVDRESYSKYQNDCLATYIKALN